jgi:hypothetical protein
LLAALAPFAYGQNPAMESDTGLRRFEIGGQVADIRTGCIGQVRSCPLPSFALGPGLALNLNQHFALDANFNVTPKSSNGGSNLDGGHASQFLAGGRAQIRGRRYGFFLKAQSGYFRWSNVITKVTFPTPSTFVFSYGSRTSFASAVGAGFEYSPSGRVHLRAEVSDLIIRYSSTSWTNNLQPTAGLYYGLGKPIDWNPPTYSASMAHPFFDRKNLALMSASILGMTADAVTTQRDANQRGGREANPFARPLVKYGWSGQISAVSLEIAAQIVGMYALHRIGQHWVERMVPACLATTHGIAAYNNASQIR